MKTNKKGNIQIVIGLLLIAAALFLVLYNIHDDRVAQRASMEAVSSLEELIPTEPPTEPEEEEEKLRYDDVEIPDFILNPDMDMPVKRVRGLDYIGILRIPVLNLKLPVVSEWNYTSLKAAPCRYTGSAYKNDMVIAAHNYVTHFGNLKKLQEGDIVTFTDIDGNMFIYEVLEMETLQPKDVDGMVSGDWDLTLFTCTVGGATRVTIRLNRISRNI